MTHGMTVEERNEIFNEETRKFINKLKCENAKLRDIIKRAQTELVKGVSGNDDDYFAAVKNL